MLFIYPSSIKCLLVSFDVLRYMATLPGIGERCRLTMTTLAAPVRGIAAGAGPQRGCLIACAAWLCHRRRAGGLANADAFHDARGSPVVRSSGEPADHGRVASTSGPRGKRGDCRGFDHATVVVAEAQCRIAQSIMPAQISVAALTIACAPEPQTRLTVSAGTSTGSPPATPA